MRMRTLGEKYVLRRSIRTLHRRLHRGWLFFLVPRHGNHLCRSTASMILYIDSRYKYRKKVITRRKQKKEKKIIKSGVHFILEVLLKKLFIK